MDNPFYGPTSLGSERARFHSLGKTWGVHLILGGAAVHLSSLMTSFTPRYQDILYSFG
jgi:hypothetical protein